jgi:tRNA-dihydrouridine synthase A
MAEIQNAFIASTQISPWCVSVAPMMAWTDRHCRHFHRLITRRTRLYTEMVTTGALVHGDVEKHLRHNPRVESPTALQIGGSEPNEMAHAARLAVQWGYDEINLNCGCPSERVQRGAFGACLMAEPTLVAEGVKAMLDAVAGEIPVTVKHRIGIDRVEHYEFVRDFVGEVARAGCQVFIVHARNAWLQGLSPKENREIPPLRYEFVHRLKREFPELTICINGGITESDQVQAQLQQVDGVMVGRAAYHDPVVMSDWDSRFWQDGDPIEPSDDWRLSVEQAMVRYIEAEQQLHGTPWAHAATHMLGLWNTRPGARAWRRVWSDHRLKTSPVQEVFRLACEARLSAVKSSAHDPAQAA